MENDLIKQGRELFNAKQYTEAIQKLNEALETAKNHQKQVNVEFWLGRCYLEQALQTGNTALFDKARQHHQEQLALAKKLDGDTGIEEQANVQFWLGYCYFNQALQTGNAALFDDASRYFQEWLECTKKLSGDKGIEKQAHTQSWLGYCYFKQALQTGNAALFDDASRYFQEWLECTKKLSGDKGVEEQINAQFWLGRCYLKQTKQTKEGIEQNLSEAEEHFGKVFELVKKATDKAFKKRAIAKLRRDFRELDFAKGKYDSYFKSKQKQIQKSKTLSKNKKINGRLKENIAAVLAVLSIDPIEFDKPLAHYTSPTVCEKLLGIGQKQANQENIVAGKMRMNSSVYMNDPYEGKSLYDLLGIQEPDLENLSESSPYNAFFACFSSRVNDLNQFRLYGKVGNVEASGCCLVFNKRGNWIREPDIDVSYRRLNEQGLMAGNDMETAAKAQRPSENLPLYQIAYIFYRDEYTQDKEYDVMFDNPNFGVRLKPISDNQDWHEVRKAQFQTALIGLCDYFKDTKQNREESQENKAALEYIRYLFKDHAFRDEEEFRLLQIEEIGSDKVQYCPDTNTAFLEYGNVCTKLDEVILGTNYERTTDCRKVEVFRHLLKRKQPHIKVRHSSLPINPPNKSVSQP